jgi:hypothetical protein
MRLNDNVDISFREGASFLFEIDDQKITYKCSSVSGKEVVLVNGEIVSQSQNFKLKSNHIFNIESVEYEIEFESKDLLKGNSECSLKKSGSIIKTYKIKYNKPAKPSTIFRIVPLILGVTVGVGISQKFIPVWICVLLGILALLIVFVSTFKSSMEGWECEVSDV